MHASLIFGTININNKAEVNFLYFSLVTHFSRRVRRKNNVHCSSSWRLKASKEAKS